MICWAPRLWDGGGGGHSAPVYYLGSFEVYAIKLRQ